MYIWKIYFQDLDLQTCHLSRIESETQAIALTNEWHVLGTIALFSKGFCPYYTNIFIYVIIDWEKIALILIVIALYANLTQLPSSQDGWSEDLQQTWK